MNAQSTIADLNEAAPARKNPLRVSWPHVVLGVPGLGTALFSVYEHWLVKNGGSACGISDSISCDKVLASPYSELFGVPLGVYGAAFFIVVILTAISTVPLETPLWQIALPRLIVAAVGLCFSVALTYISITKIKAVCPTCLATHALTLTNFLFALWGFVKAWRRRAAATAR